jgi:arsenate reductase
MAEVIWNRLGQGRWIARSAGARPSGYVHPLALLALQEIGLPVTGLTSKSSEGFRDAPFDLVVTVCDSAREACPVWPSAKKVLHWPFEDPAEATGSDEQKLEVFRRVRDQIEERIRSWLQAEEAV